MIIKKRVNNLAYFAAALILPLTSVTALHINRAPQTHAVGHYQNHELADHALTFVKQWGGNACANTGKPASGTCKGFVNCIVYAVSGKTQWPVAANYNEGFRQAGGLEVSRSQATRGDIIQVGNYDSDATSLGNLHTAIVLTNKGNGTFSVVDSNFSEHQDQIVRQHDYTPPSTARFWRMGQVGLNGPVIGSIDNIRRAPGGIHASGWSIDQDIPSATYVHLYSGDGELMPTNPGKELYANQYREDIGRIYPKYGPGHGFSGIIAARNAGHQRVCAYGINVAGTPGSYERLGCKDITVSPDPFGRLESAVRVSGGIQIRGWTIDPDTASSIKVHTYGGSGAPGVSSNAFISAVASANRDDVASHYLDYGTKHGFNIFLPTSSSKQNICVYAINNATNGHNPQLGCKHI